MRKDTPEVKKHSRPENITENSEVSLTINVKGKVAFLLVASIILAALLVGFSWN